MADKVGELYIEMSAKVDKLNQQLADVKAKVEKTARQTEQEFARTRPQMDVSGLLGGLTAVTAAMAMLKLAKDSLADWSKQEKASNRLAQALRNAGVAAGDLASVQAEMEGFSTSLMNVTAYADETVTEVQAMITAMTGMTGQAVRPLTMAVLDLASGMGIDVETAAKLVSKTMEGSDALGRYGISVKGARSDAEKLSAVVGGIASRFGGFARNELNTLDGKMKHLQNQVGETRESFGQLLSQAINPMMPAIERLADFMGRMLLSAVVSVKGKMAEMFAGSLSMIIGLYEMAKKIPLLGALAPLGEGTIDKMKGWVAEAAKIATEAKVELDRILHPGHQGEQGMPLASGGKGASTKRTLTDEEKKAIAERAKLALEAERELEAAKARIQMEGISDELDREAMAVALKYNLDRRALEDKAKLEGMEQRTLNDGLLVLYYQFWADLLEIDRKGRERKGKEQKKEAKAWEETHQAMAWAVQDTVGIMDAEWGDALHKWLAEGQSFTNATAHLWSNMANRIIADIMRISTEYLFGLALLAIPGFGATGIGGALIRGFGVTVPAPAKAAGGGSFTVPPGFENDSFPLMVQSGERVTVTPAGRFRAEQMNLAGIERRLDVLNMNLAGGSTRGDLRLGVAVTGEIGNGAIYLANRKGERVYERTR